MTKRFIAKGLLVLSIAGAAQFAAPHAARAGDNGGCSRELCQPGPTDAWCKQLEDAGIGYLSQCWVLPPAGDIPTWPDTSLPNPIP
jgi:hypothetical protein